MTALSMWCGHPDEATCSGGPHDSVNDVTGDLVVDSDDFDQANDSFGDSIGPTEDTSASPDPSCS